MAWAAWPVGDTAAMNRPTQNSAATASSAARMKPAELPGQEHAVADPGHRDEQDHRDPHHGQVGEQLGADHPAAPAGVVWSRRRTPLSR